MAGGVYERQPLCRNCQRGEDKLSLPLPGGPLLDVHMGLSLRSAFVWRSRLRSGRTYLLPMGNREEEKEEEEGRCVCSEEEEEEEETTLTLKRF